jgi:SnoaL-like domain
MEDKILELVKESPRLVKAHEKAKWIALFSKEGEIEDPVGSKIYKHEDFGNFWDAFIAPNDITFHLNFEILSGNQVIRDVKIHTKLDSGHEVWVPAHLFYTVKKDDEKLSVISMYANWDLSKMVFEFLKFKGSIKAMTALSFRILRHLGFPGIWGFTKAFLFGIKKHGDRVIRSNAISQHFAENPNINFSIKDLSNLKILNTNSSGYFTSFSFEKDGKKGIGNFKFSPISKKIISGKIYFS